MHTHPYVEKFSPDKTSGAIIWDYISGTYRKDIKKNLEWIFDVLFFVAKNFRRQRAQITKERRRIDSSKNIRISEDEHGTENFAIWRTG